MTLYVREILPGMMAKVRKIQKDFDVLVESKGGKVFQKVLNGKCRLR